MKKKTLLLISFVFFICNAAVAQNEAEKELSLDKGSLENQFDYVIKKSGKYQEYKVVKRVWLNKLKKNVADSVLKSNNTIVRLDDQIQKQQEEIQKLNTDLAELEANLATVNQEKESISFFGSLTNKGTYKTIMWTIVITLALLLLFFIFKFKNSNRITTAAKLSLQDMEQEFEQHRRRSLEMQQKLSRQLQDEINKQKMMKK